MWFAVNNRGAEWCTKWKARGQYEFGLTVVGDKGGSWKNRVSIEWSPMSHYLRVCTCHIRATESLSTFSYGDSKLYCFFQRNESISKKLQSQAAELRNMQAWANSHFLPEIVSTIPPPLSLPQDCFPECGLSEWV